MKLSRTSSYAPEPTTQPKHNRVIRTAAAICALGVNCVLQAPAEDGALLWSFTTRDFVRSSPAIAPNGTVYAGSLDNCVYALNGANGQYKWSYKAGGNITQALSLGADGTLYVPCADKYIYALDGTKGTLKWKHYAVGTPSGLAVGANGVLYYGRSDGFVEAIDRDTGFRRWVYCTVWDVNSTPALGTNGLLYFGADDRKVYALAADTGAKVWEYLTGGHVNSSPAIGADCTVYIGSDDNRVYALDGANGRLKWQYLTGGDVNSAAIAADGTVYIGANDTYLYALDGRTGTCKARVSLGYNIPATPAIGSDGSVYVQSGGMLYAFDADLKYRWSRVLHFYSTANDSSVVIGTDGTLYVGSMDHGIYAFKGNSATGASGPWPMLGQNPQHTGRGWASAFNLCLVRNQPTGLRLMLEGTAGRVYQIYRASSLGSDWSPLCTVTNQIGTQPVLTLDPAIAPMSLFRASLAR